VRAPLDCTLAPERVLLALRHEPHPFALVGDWAAAAHRRRAAGAAARRGPVRGAGPAARAGPRGFQANLCLRLEAAWDGDVMELFAAGVSRLRPAYGACFPGVASFSPELFLRRRGTTVVTGPIKGTAPSDPEALRRSLKDRAEHVMIVDLMRNDLGRVARYGTVRATAGAHAAPPPRRLAPRLRGRSADRREQRGTAQSDLPCRR
jgi:hypothetical protein